MSKTNEIMTKNTTKTRKSWTNKKYPDMKGWTRSVHMRGPNDKHAGQHYYTYYPPSGDRRQLRSLKQVNARMETEKNEQKMEDQDHEVVVVTPEVSKPEVIDLTRDELNGAVPSFNVYRNVTMHVSPGGGYHIKWNS